MTKKYTFYYLKGVINLKKYHFNFTFLFMLACITLLISCYFNYQKNEFIVNIFLGLFTSCIMSIITELLLFRLDYKEQLTKIMRLVFNLTNNIENISNIKYHTKRNQLNKLPKTIYNIYKDSKLVVEYINNLSFMYKFSDKKYLTIMRDYCQSIINSIEQDYFQLLKCKDIQKRKTIYKIIKNKIRKNNYSRFTRACAKISVKYSFVEYYFINYFFNYFT